MNAKERQELIFSFRLNISDCFVFFLAYGQDLFIVEKKIQIK